MRVAQHAAAKEQFYQRVGKTHANRVNENVTGRLLQRLDTDSIVRDRLPEQGPRRIVLARHQFVTLELNKAQVVPFEVDLGAELLADGGAELVRGQLGARVNQNRIILKVLLMLNRLERLEKHLFSPTHGIAEGVKEADYP